MAAVDYTLTETPTDVVAALSLTVGRRYRGQYSGPDRVFYKAATTVPTAGDAAFKTGDEGTMSIVPVAGEGIYFWVGPKSGGILVVDEI